MYRVINAKDMTIMPKLIKIPGVVLGLRNTIPPNYCCTASVMNFIKFPNTPFARLKYTSFLLYSNHSYSIISEVYSPMNATQVC